MSTLKRKLESKGTYKALENMINSREVNEDYITREGEVIISHEAMKDIDLLVHKVNLSEYVQVVEVEYATGTYPYLDCTETILESVLQLEQGSALPHPIVTPIDYEIQTYRGVIPVAYETIEDAGVDATKIFIENAKQADINTKNREIINTFKMATTQSVTGVEGLTTLINKGFKSIYEIKLFLSSSLYNVLDNEGLIEYRDGASFKGHEVIKLDDTMIGELDGDLVGFIGDPKRFTFLFDKQSVTVKDYMNKDLNIALLCSSRFDVKEGDSNAGAYITYSV